MHCLRKRPLGPPSGDTRESVRPYQIQGHCVAQTASPLGADGHPERPEGATKAHKGQKQPKAPHCGARGGIVCF
eukprot:scaffold7095_cov260-Pinguiococcus_pyrenoidosus.AAC.12